MKIQYKVILKIINTEWNNSYYFISFISVTIANSSDKTNIEIKVKHQRMLKKSKDKNKWLNTFDLQRDLLKRSWSNNSYLKNKRYIGAISYKTHLYVYILLFSFWWIAKIWNQILQVERSISLNDSRLSNIAHIVIDILHTICSAIPLFCPCYKYNEKIIDSTNFNGDEFVFISLLQYILLSLALIIIHRFLLLGIKELRSWIKFIKLLILFYSFWFIWRNYAISFILKVGAINLLFIMNISWNIISKKTVTEDLLTVTLKFILYAISPTILIKNNYYKWLEIRDLITCLPSLRVDVSNMKSYNFYDSIKINQQRLIIQIVMILILFLQKKYGSLFFLPSWFRTKIYESMAKDIRQFSQTEIEKSWTFWTNLLWQRELIYSDDSDQDLNTTNSRVLYETKWGLIYHHRCFFKSLTGFPNCPHWGYTIPKDEWDD